MSKRGQIAIFIIIAVIIVVAVAIVLYTNQKEIPNQDSLSPESEKIITESTECLNQESKSALDLIGLQGGFYNKPEYYSDEFTYFIGYHYFDGTSQTPSLEQVQNSLSEYINDNLKSCIEKIDLAEPNVEITISKTKTVALIKKDDVYFKTEVNMEIKSGNKTEFKKELETNINSPIYDMIETTQILNSLTLEDPEYFPLPEMITILEERGIEISIDEYYDSKILVLAKNVSDNEQYIYQFLYKYSQNEQ